MAVINGKRVIIVSKDKDLATAFMFSIIYNNLIPKEEIEITDNLGEFSNCALLIFNLGNGFDRKWVEAFLEFVGRSDHLPHILLFSTEEPDWLKWTTPEKISPLGYFLSNSNYHSLFISTSDFDRFHQKISETKCQSRPVRNPFKNFTKIVQFLKEKIFPDKNAVDFHKALYEFNIGIRDSGFHKFRRLRFYHGLKGEEERIYQAFVEFAIENLVYLKKNLDQTRTRVIWIENNPRDIVSISDKRSIPLIEFIFLLLECFPTFEIFLIANQDEMKNLYNHVREIEEGEKERTCFKLSQVRKDTSNPIQVKDIRLFSSGDDKKGFDLILLDLFLGEKEGPFDLTGEDFLEVFTNYLPEVPVFILSKIDDFNEIRDLLKSGADYYILKKHTLLIPIYFRRFYDSVGSLVTILKNQDLKKNLTGNIRYWRFKSDYLWFGDKCYHMVDHSFDHISNEWQLANSLLYPILERNPKLMNVKGDDWEENLYSFCMAIWLHDIGHKGSCKCGDPHQIRDKHGVISAEFILGNPDLFGIVGYEKAYGNEYNCLKKELENKSIVHLVKENLEKKGKQPNTLEKIALISMFHKGNSPLTKKDSELIKKSEKRIPIDFYPNLNREQDPITLSDVIESNSDFLSIVALFRFIDGLDIRKNRVGDRNERQLKVSTVEQDVEFQVKVKIQKEQERLLRRLGGSLPFDKRDKRSFQKLFYDEIEKKILGKQRVNSQKQIEFINKMLDLENYYLLLEFAEFLSVQDGHFSLHSSIDDVRIRHEDPNLIEIHYLSNQPEDFLLKEKVVREYFEKEDKTIAEHLIGNEKDSLWQNGYVLKELNAGEELLRRWFHLRKIGLWGFKSGNLKLVSGIEYDSENGIWKRWTCDKTLHDYEAEMQR